MNALKDLTSGMGCSTDGTAATANPLTGLVNQTLGMNKQQQGMPGFGRQAAHRNAAQTEMEMAMSGGMGLSHRPDMMRQPQNRNILNSGFHAPQQQGFAQEFAMQQQHLLGHQQGNSWVGDFQRMNLHHAQPTPQFLQQSERAMGWSREMNMAPNFEMDQAWRQMNNAQRGNQWANQMAQQSQYAQTEEGEEEEVTQSEQDKMEATRRATEDMVRIMSDNPKFRKSGFFDFMQKVSQGELSFENNEVVPGPQAGVSLRPRFPSSPTFSTFHIPHNARTNASKQQHQDPMAAAWAQTAQEPHQQAWDASLDQAGQGLEDMFQRAWQDEGAQLSEAEMDEAWKQMLNQAQTEGYDSAWTSAMQQINPLEAPYEMAANNPYAANPHAFDEGVKLFHEGRLREATLAFQSVVTQEPAHSEAWRMLGMVHQENDEDKLAIMCLERAVEHDAYNLDALLGLGVSYVNELDHNNALKNLKLWVMHNPSFVGLEVQQDDYSDGSMMDEVMQLMLKAAEWAPKDPGVHEVLGVLFNVTRDYGSAVSAFKKAVSIHPDSYGLWNKCGATLANSSPARSEEAIPAYLRAIELRPGYARAHLNLGISYNNLGNFEAAARAYLKAVELNPSATHIWQYLRISLTCMERSDLVALCENRDFEGLKRAF